MASCVEDGDEVGVDQVKQDLANLIDRGEDVNHCHTKANLQLNVALSEVVKELKGEAIKHLSKVFIPIQLKLMVDNL